MTYRPTPVSHAARLGAILLALGAATACAGRTAAPRGPAPIADRYTERYATTEADVRFMTMMIAHHAQAVEMSNLAPTHGASPAVQRLAARIINAQQDEIATMTQWLRDRGRPVPAIVATLPRAGAANGAAAGEHAGHDAHAGHEGHAGGTGGAGMPMHGMLTAAQMGELDAARGRRFDELFLRFMIQHHKGAVTMVDELFATDGAGQDETIFKFASDVQVDQRTEIARMEQMLFDVLSAG